MSRIASAAPAIAAPLVLALSTAPAFAQEMRARTNEVHVYVGQFFGDDLTDGPIDAAGTTPEVDDDITWGVRYGYNFTEMWGIDVSAGWTPTAATSLAGDDIDLDITTLDISAIWHFTPDSPLVGYTIFGLGYAMADLDTPIPAVVDGLPAVIDDDDGFTANAGIGAKWFATEAMVIRGEARYRYIDKLVDTLDDSLNSFEVTLGLGWRF